MTACACHAHTYPQRPRGHHPGHAPWHSSNLHALAQPRAPFSPSPYPQDRIWATDIQPQPCADPHLHTLAPVPPLTLLPHCCLTGSGPWVRSSLPQNISVQADISLAQQGDLSLVPPTAAESSCCLDLRPTALLLPPCTVGPAAPPSTPTPPSPNTSALSMGASTQKTSSSRSAPHLPHPRARVRAAREKPSCWMPPASPHSSPPGWQQRRSPRPPQSQQQQQQQPQRGRIMRQWQRQAAAAAAALGLPALGKPAGQLARV